MVDAADAVWLSVLPDMSKFGPGILKGADKEADRAGKSFGTKFGKAALAGTAVIVGGAGLAVKALYGIGETFDDVSDTIRVGTGATGEALAGLEESAKRIGRNVPAEFSAIGTAVADVNTRLGLTGPTLETFTSQVLELGRITGEDVDIHGLSASFNAFQVEGEATIGALDHLYRVSQATGIGVNDLASQVANSAPAVQQLGFSFEETAALVGNLDKAGLNSSRMMMGMSQALVRLAEDGEQPADAFRRTIGEIEGFLKAGDKAAAIDLAGEVFGTRNATQFIGALESGTLAMDDLASVAGMTEDTILGAGKETMDFAEQWQIFKNRILVTLEPIASRVFGAIGDLMEQITEGVTLFTDAWNRNDSAVTASGLPGFMQRLGSYARQAFDFLSANKDVLISLAAALGTAGAALLIYNAYVKVAAAVTKAWSVVQQVLNGAMRANPIGIVITILALLVGAIVLAYQRSETFRNIVQGAWRGIQQVVGAVWEWLKGVFEGIKAGLGAVGEWFKARGRDISNVWEGIRAALGSAWIWIQANVFLPIRKGINLVKMSFQFAKDGAILIWNALKAGLKAGWDWIDRWVFAPIRLGIDLVRLSFKYAKEGALTIWEGLRRGLRAGWNWISDHVFAPFGRGIDTLVGWFRDGKRRIGDLWNGLKGIIVAPINWIITNAWNRGLLRAINAVASVIPGVDEIDPLPTIRTRAKGGFTPKGWTLVGEEGPELVNFTAPGRVYTAAETRAALAGGRNPLQSAFSRGNPPHGGFGDWVGDRWEDIKSVGSSIASGVRDAAGNVVQWARGSLAKAAGIILNPVKTLIDNTVGSSGGYIGRLVGGTGKMAIDKMLAWLRGKDGEVPTDAGGRTLRGARSYVNNFAHALADQVGGIRMMQAFNQSMAGGHPAGRAVDFIDSIAKLNRLADVITRTGGFDRFSYMAWQGRLWSPGRGWRPQGRGFGNDPYHRWHLHAEWYDQGGLLQPGLNLVANGTRKPERVLTDPQWRAIEGGLFGSGGSELTVNVDANLTDLEHRVAMKTASRVGDVIRSSRMSGVKP